MKTVHHFATLLLCLLAPALNAAGTSSRLPSITSTVAMISPRQRTVQGLPLPQLETYPLLSRLAFSWANDFVLRKRGDNVSLAQTDIWDIGNSAKSMYNISRRFDTAREQVLQTTSRAKKRGRGKKNVLSLLWNLPLFRMLVLM